MKIKEDLSADVTLLSNRNDENEVVMDILRTPKPTQGRRASFGDLRKTSIIEPPQGKDYLSEL